MSQDKKYGPPPIIPDEETPRVFGRLTIIIASVLLVGNLYSLAFFAAIPVMKPLSVRLEKWGKRFVDDQMKAQTLKIERLQAVAADPAKKAQYDAQIAAMKKQPMAQFNTMSISFAGSDSPQITLYSVVDACLGLILNTFMLLGGIGLASLKSWGHRTTWWVCCLKLCRIAMFGILMMLWILPIQIRDMREKLAGAFQNGGPPPPGINPDALAATTTSSVVFYGLVAAIYPILLLVQLRKTRIKAACGIGPKSTPLDGELA